MRAAWLSRAPSIRTQRGEHVAGSFLNTLVLITEIGCGPFAHNRSLSHARTECKGATDLRVHITASAPRELFHHLSIALAYGTTYYVAKLIDGAVADTVKNKESLPALLNNALFRQNRQVLADICLAH